MQQEYKATLYVLALAAVITLTTGFVVAADAGTDDPTEAQLDKSDVEFTGDYDTLSEEEREKLVELTLADSDVQTYINESTVPNAPHRDSNALEFEVSERTTFDEDAEAFVQVDDEVAVEITPTDERLPYAFVMVDLNDETVSIEHGKLPLGNVDVAVSDEEQYVNVDERDDIEEILLSDPEAEWDIKSLFGDVEKLDVNITDRDENIAIVEVTKPDDDSYVANADINLDKQSVESIHFGDADASVSVVSIDSIDVVDGNEVETSVEENISVSLNEESERETESDSGTADAEEVEIEANVPDKTEYDVEISDVNVTLVEYDDSLGGLTPQEIVSNTFEVDSIEDTFTEFDSVEMTLVEEREYDEEAEEMVATGNLTADITPDDSRLPNVVATVDPTDETVTIEQVTPALDEEEVTVEIIDENGQLNSEERELVRDLVFEDDGVSQNVQTRLDEPETVTATVTNTGDDDVMVELESPDVDSTSVMMTVDLDEGEVTQTYMTMVLTEEVGNSYEVEIVDGE